MILEAGVYLRRQGNLPGPFGLVHGQSYSHDQVVRAAAWFNHEGQHLGTGDILPASITRLRDELPADEAFLILSGPEATTQVLADRAPAGIHDLLPHVKYIVVRGTVYMVFDPDPHHRPRANAWIIQTAQRRFTGIIARLLPREEVEETLGRLQPP
jgi:hypothetical protein